MSARPFVLFGPDHGIALLVIATVAGAISLGVRRDPAGAAARAARLLLAAFLIVATLILWIEGLRGGMFRWFDLLPFHLCDLAIFLAAFALVTRSAAVYEVLYYWAFGGTALAVLTPDVARGFPDPGYLSFFAIHGGVLASAAVLTWGSGMRPRRGSARRMFLWTAAYAAGVGVINAVFGTNFLYLCAKPSAPTLLDSMGPWPWYILTGALLALGIFQLLELPFRRRGSGAAARADRHSGPSGRMPAP